VGFTSLAFYAWLAGAVIVHRLLPARWRGNALVVFSALFCGASSLTALFLLTTATFVAFLAGIVLADADPKNESKRARILYVALVLLVGPLVGFKAAGVLKGVVVPLGLSYYTFKLTSYVVETYWDSTYVQRRFLDFAAYSAFGAQLVAGPIQRPASFFEQLGKIRKGVLDDADFEKGFRLIVYGAFLKLVIGDRLATFVQMVTSKPDDYSRPVLAATAFSYLPQLFADFAGYTNIALGVGLLFGIEGPPNFDRPFAASNLQEYWRRWHMSLTTWLNDYVFMPLRMGTRTWGKVGLVASLFVNMTLIGVWHGFTWYFLAFGVLHGAFISVSVLTLKQRTRFWGRWPWLSPFRTVFGIVVVQILLAVSQIFFQATSIESAWSFACILIGTKAAGSLRFADIRADVSDPLLACWLFAMYVGLGAPGTKRLREAVAQWVPNYVRYGLCLLAIAALTLEEGGKFIYGQF
jgi:alginate O-acetyltransferase complex protein AlgI